MIIFTSVPIFALNIIFSIIATKKIINAAHFSDYKPRFDFLFLIIWGYVPLSFASALTDSFFLKTIHQSYNYCFFFSTLRCLAFFTFMTPPALSLYFFLLMFTKLKLETVNKVGNIMCVFLYIFCMVEVYFMTVYLGVKRDQFLDNGMNKECDCSNEIVIGVIFNFELFIQILVILFIILVVGYEKYLALYGNKKDTKTKFSRINLIKSFIYIVVATLVLSILDRIVKKMNFLPKWVYYIFIDIRRSKPFFYSLIIIFCDKPISLSIKNYSLKVIFNIPELNKMFESFLNSKGSKRMKELVKEFKDSLKKNEENEKGEYILNVNDEKERREMGKSVDALEKEIFLEGLNEFYLTDEFIFFLYKFQMTGIIELEMDLDRS